MMQALRAGSASQLGFVQIQRQQGQQGRDVGGKTVVVSAAASRRQSSCPGCCSPSPSSSSPRSLRGGFLAGTPLPLPLRAAKGRSERARVKRGGAARAVIATDRGVGVTREFALDGGARVKVQAVGAGNGAPALVEVRVEGYSGGALLLHWGATREGSTGWLLPGSRPPGTSDYKGKALQTRFGKDDAGLALKIELTDPALNAIEFLIKDEAKNAWFKLDGGNFRVEIPRPQQDVSQIQLPEELVQVQAYLRWERRGKQSYSPEQEKVEYEEARRELQEEVAQGTSVDALRRKLLAKDAGSGSNGNGAAAAAENGAAQDKGSENGSPKKEKEVPVAHVKRKSRDPVELVNKVVKGGGKAAAAAPPPPRQPTPLELGAEVMEGADQGKVVLKKMFRFGDGQELLVLVTNPEGVLKVRLATNIKDPVALHWALSKEHAREWLAPPKDIVPADSNLGPSACETPFKVGFAGDGGLQSVEIPVGDGGYVGMPFVFRVGGNWYKDSGSDFYVSFQAAAAKAAAKAGGGEGTAKSFLDDVADQESEAERSLMHRYNIAAGFAERAKREGELALAGMLVWLRFMATRQLTWNRNYNVKPREISAAQDRLTNLLQETYREQPENREMVRLIMATVGRGGQGDVGQRIRDEILVIQRNNDCSGGMMEEWHQKLHNNTSPDDVVICQALLDHIQSDFSMDAYWKTLTDNGISKQRLASYDRPIVSEPKFRHDQKDGLVRDLTAYMRTLKAVHSGADLESAIETCMGYTAEGKGFMGGVKIHPISGLSSDLPGLLQFVLEHVEDQQTLPLIEGLLEARRELRPTLQTAHDRLRDIIFLDLALDSTVRTAVERGLESFRKASPADLILVISLVVENLALSVSDNEELVYCLKDWYHILELCKAGADQWALRAKAVLDRTRLILADKAEYYQTILQPSAEYLGGRLGVEKWAIEIFTEEMIRAGSAASLSQLANLLDPTLRNIAHLGSWQVISPVEVRGFVEVVGELGEVEDKRYGKPTILVSGRVKGEEEIPDGAVAVLTPDMPDVLSHVSVRARNGKVCFATCFDPDVLADLRKKKGKAISIQLKGGSLAYSEITDAEVSKHGGAAGFDDAPPPHIVLKKKKFAGKYAITAEQFNPELVGAKSRNIANLRGKVPSWVKLPTSVALPFGTFEKVLSESINRGVADELAALSKKLQAGDFHRLKEAREICLKLQPPPQLIEELKTAMKGSNMPWPGDEGDKRWQLAWTAIKKVWGSKWNERAYFSTRKAGIDHSDLCMAVLVQEVIQADYAFVIHTTNPANGDASEIYAEVVKGLGETLVGAYSGRALSFVTKKTNLKAPTVLGYPSKRIGLFIKQSIIFRSDSNGEDLEGYAGAGLYDSVPMDHEEEKAVDYSTDKLLLDTEFQKQILTKIAEVGSAVEKLLGTAQDIEGVIKNGELYIVQTRPQM